MVTGRRYRKIEIFTAAAAFVVLCSIFLYIWNGQQSPGWALPLGFLITVFIFLTVFFLLKENRKVSDAREVLVQKEQEFRALAENSPDLIVRLNRKLNYLYINPAVEREFNMPAQKILGKNSRDLEFTDESILRKWNDTLQQVFDTERETILEMDVNTPQGKKYFHLRVIPEKSREGRVDTVLALARDITDRKHMEEALQESENKFRLLFDSANDAILLMKDGIIIDCNPKFLELFETDRDRVIGRNIYSLSLSSQPDGSDSKEKAVEKLGLAEAGLSQLFEWRYIRREGTYLDIEVSLNRLIIQGDVVIQAIIRDITERKKSEDQLIYLSFHDKLTGLYNRAYFEEELKRLDTSRQLPISIIMGDVNGLKLVNDVFGHHEGDKLLKRAAEIIKNSCRKEDIVSRWGGDEFIILLPRTSREHAQEISVRIRDACRGSYSGSVQTSISLGSAVKEDMDQSIYTVLKEAEDNMYKQKLMESKSIRSSVISTLLKTLGEKTHETEEHTLRLEKLALKMGKELNFPESQLDDLALLAMLHDIGKIAVPDTILTKPGALTPEEWSKIKSHPEIGYRIASSVVELSHISDGILSHHEWWDGSGYPRGLKGEEIPLHARIIAVVDAYDVMTQKSSYKEAISPEKATEELKMLAGRQFDPHLVKLFIEKIIPEIL